MKTDEFAIPFVLDFSKNCNNPLAKGQSSSVLGFEPDHFHQAFAPAQTQRLNTFTPPNQNQSPKQYIELDLLTKFTTQKYQNTSDYFKPF